MANEAGKLFEQFVVPPFSVLDTAQGYWQDRRRLWKSLGIDSVQGRGQNLTYNGKSDDFLSSKLADAGTTSIFDPVLCELAYRWFTPNTGSILDPFSGGSVRGIVAGKLGRSYVGVDLRAEQVEENRAQLATVCPGANVTYVCGDSCNLDTLDGVPRSGVDFVFTCPPYGDLEKYSEDPLDLSNMKVGEFKAAYARIIRESVALLKPNRFAAFVTGNYRVGGNLVDLGGVTIQAFEDAWCPFYNNFIIVNSVNTLCLRVGKQFTASRKAGNRHQEMLVFVKGDPKKATQALGDVDPTYPGGVFARPGEESVLDLFL